jgi:RND family efflux transporter MFP subunit
MALRWLTLGLLGIAIASSAGCRGGNATPVKADTGRKTIPVTVAPVASSPVVRTVEMVGTLKGWEEVIVGAKRTGRVVRILHDMGDHVEPGEPLVELDPVDADLAQQLAESQYLGDLVKLGITTKQADEFIKKFGMGEQLLRGEIATNIIESVPSVVQMRYARDKAQSELSRQRQLSQRGVGTSQELQDRENDYRVAQAAYDNAIVTARAVIASALASRVALDQARQARDDMTIRAPVPSMMPESHSEPVEYAITRRNISEGRMLAVGEEVFALVIENPLRLWGSVPERFSAEVEVGQDVDIRVASYDRVFQGKVARINPSVDPVSRTFQVEVKVPNDDRLLRPGGFAKASIITRRDDTAIVVPREAIVRFAGVTKVYVIPGDRDEANARAVPVTTGLEGEGWVEVQGELESGQRVATSGLGQLADGTSVKIRDAILEDDGETAEGAEPKAIVAPANEAPPVDEAPPAPADAQAPAPK